MYDGSAIVGIAEVTNNPYPDPVMMKYLGIVKREKGNLRERVIAETGGIHGIVNPMGMESALARLFACLERCFQPEVGMARL